MTKRPELVLECKGYMTMNSVNRDFDGKAAIVTCAALGQGFAHVEPEPDWVPVCAELAVRYAAESFRA